MIENGLDSYNYFPHAGKVMNAFSALPAATFADLYPSMSVYRHKKICHREFKSKSNI